MNNFVAKIVNLGCFSIIVNQHSIFAKFSNNTTVLLKSQAKTNLLVQICIVNGIVLCYNKFMKVKVYAKLNLTLNVFPPVGGFHPIDSVVTSVNIWDVVEVKSRKDKKVKIKGFLPTPDNIAYKTATAFMAQFDTLGVDITIKKGIPVGAGMGGSSADSAGVIYCMCKLFGVDIESQQVANLCATLGSDISFMLRGGIARMQGKGDDVTFGQCPFNLYFALTRFSQSMSTADVYNAFDSLPEQRKTDSEKLFNLLCNGNLAIELQNNNLQPACQSLSSYAQSYIQCATDLGYAPNMTGSGSAYYIWCMNQTNAQTVTKFIQQKGFNCAVVHSVPVGVEPTNEQAK